MKTKKEIRNFPGLLKRTGENSSLVVKQTPHFYKHACSFKSIFFCQTQRVLFIPLILVLLVGLAVGCQSELSLQETTLYGEGETNSSKTQQTTHYWLESKSIA
jgi:hypothetical protein